VVAEIDVLDPETEAFEEAEAGAVEKTGHDPADATEVGEYEADLFAREDHGESFGFLGSSKVVKPGERLLKDFPVQKEKCGGRLVLGGGGDVAVDRQVGEKLGGVLFAQLIRVPFAAETMYSRIRLTYPSSVRRL